MQYSCITVHPRCNVIFGNSGIDSHIATANWLAITEKVVLLVCPQVLSFSLSHGKYAVVRQEHFGERKTTIVFPFLLGRRVKEIFTSEMHKC